MTQLADQDPGDRVFRPEVVADERLAALHRYDILDTPPEEAFDRLTDLAADVFEVDVAFVAFLDADRQWFKSSVGLDQKETDLVGSFCTYTIDHGDLLVIEDATEDDRVSTSPFVTEAGLYFYAGVPVTTPEGHAIGTFSIMDREPRSLSAAEVRRLRQLARMGTEALERRRESRKHEQMARRFEAVLQDPNLLTGVLSPDGAMLETNETSLQYIDEGREEVLGQPFWETPWWPPRLRDAVRQWVRRAAEGEYVEFEADLTEPNGEPFSVEGTVRPVTGEEGSVTALIVSARDVTDRKEREQELRLFKEVVEQANDAIVVTEAEPLEPPGPRIEYANQAFVEMTGYQRDEILDETPRILQGPKTDRAVLDSIRTALEDETAWEGETFNYRKDGTSYQVRWSLTPVRGEDGQVERWASVQQDVTEKRQREEALRRQRNLLEQAQRLAGAWEVDLRTEEMTWSDKVYEIHELSPSTEVTVEEGIAFYAPEVQSRIRAAFEQCMEEGEPFDMEIPLITAEGNRRWIRTVGAPVRVEDGEVLKVAGALQDITERKRAEKELEQTKRFYKQVLEQVPIDLAVFTPDAEFVYLNPQSMSDPERREWIIGRTNEEYIRERGMDPAIGERRDAVIRKAAQMETRTELEETLETEDGPVHYLRVHGPVTNLEGEVTHVAAFGLDITERKRRRRRLERYREYTDRLLNASDDLFFVCDAEGILRRWNDQLVVVSGYSEEMLEGMDVFEFIPEAHRDEAKVAFDEVFETGRSQQEIPVRTKDGRIIPYEFAANCVEHPDGHLRLVGIGRDITERKLRERELVAAKEQAEEASRLKSAVLANMNHEIRTPLTSVTGFAELLEERLEGESKTFAEKIRVSGERLVRTLDSVLALSRLEAGNYEMKREDVSLTEVVDETVRLIRPVAEQEPVALEAHLPDGPVEGRWNEGALNRILENLVENAIKFTPEGGTVDVRVWGEGSTAILEVRDTGVGISEDSLPMMFEAFKQESEGKGREYEGSGLGLSIVKRLTEALGGTVEVESEKGEGSCFTVRLPWSGTNSAQESGEAVPPG